MRRTVQERKEKLHFFNKLKAFSIQFNTSCGQGEPRQHRWTREKTFRNMKIRKAKWKIPIMRISEWKVWRVCAREKKLSRFLRREKLERKTWSNLDTEKGYRRGNIGKLNRTNGSRKTKRFWINYIHSQRRTANRTRKREKVFPINMSHKQIVRKNIINRTQFLGSAHRRRRRLLCPGRGNVNKFKARERSQSFPSWAFAFDSIAGNRINWIWSISTDGMLFLSFF